MIKSSEIDSDNRYKKYMWEKKVNLIEMLMLRKLVWQLLLLSPFSKKKQKSFLLQGKAAGKIKEQKRQSHIH